MRRTFEIFTLDQPFEMCHFLSSMSEKKRKFNITPWQSADRRENGFIVWYNK